MERTNGKLPRMFWSSTVYLTQLKLSLFFSAKYAFRNANSHRTLRSLAHGWSSDDFTEINRGLTALLL